MKHLRLFPNAQVRNSVLADIDYKILSKTDGEPGVGIQQGTWVNPKSIPFYVENITQEAETLTIAGYNFSDDGSTSYFEIPVEYSTDGTNWSSLGTTGATTLTRTLQPGDKVYLRATTNTWCEKQQDLWIDHSCSIFGISKVGGNIMSLLYGSEFTGNETEFPSGSNQNFAYIFTIQEWGETENNAVLTDASELILPVTTLTERCYEGMFCDCSSLTAAPALPAMTMWDRCYQSMFQRCSSLTVAPALPATTLAQSCYVSMFNSCTSLTTAPVLPAMTLAPSCYQAMFYNCMSLTTAPALPATTLAEGCYSSMFQGCTSLTTAPALPATTLAQSCYTYMFNGCTSLTTAPVLPAMTLANYCYQSMFQLCTSLTTAPALPATTLAIKCYGGMFVSCTSLATAPALPATTLVGGCYFSMFQGCTSLTTAPVLPATTLADNCYQYMFNGCSSLTTAPELPAETLTGYCYQSMFNGCTNLNHIKCLATDISASNCTSDWVKIVASKGTFVKNPAMTGWTTGNNGIPSGWTVEDAQL